MSAMYARPMLPAPAHRPIQPRKKMSTYGFHASAQPRKPPVTPRIEKARIGFRPILSEITPCPSDAM
eukprot:914774-Prymnesium_polylepis.1